MTDFSTSVLLFIVENSKTDTWEQLYEEGGSETSEKHRRQLTSAALVRAHPEDTSHGRVGSTPAARDPFRALQSSRRQSHCKFGTHKIGR